MQIVGVHDRSLVELNLREVTFEQSFKLEVGFLPDTTIHQVSVQNCRTVQQNVLKSFNFHSLVSQPPPRDGTGQDF